MKKNDGQSLIEMIVAIAVVLIVVVALVAITTVSIRNANFSRNQALATKYAQEGIEKVRAYRDQTDWATFTGNCQAPPGLTAPPSPFTRTITCPGNGDTREVKVVVSWTDAQGPHKSELTTYLTKWK